MRARLFIISICCIWLAVGPPVCFGQVPAPVALAPPDSLPGWIVPVLRLVSANRVEPTTGVVISSTGLVLVADDFASSTDEIIVLDGGTDIIRNGRPAKIARRFPAQGLMVLSVRALQRNAAQFTLGDPEDGSSVRLQAFPPAKLIEQGAAPLDVSATIHILPESSKVTLAGDTPLPNVAGPILDACGKLTGYSSADGVQSMSTSESPRYHWKRSLLAVLAEMQIDVIEMPCEQLSLVPGLVDDALVDAEDEPVLEPEHGPEDAATEPADETETPAEESMGDEIEHDQGQEDESKTGPDVLPAIDDEARDRDDADDFPARARLFAIVLLLGSILVLYRIRRNRSRSTQTVPQASQNPPSIAQDNDVKPAYPLPAMDSLLVIEGILSDGTKFRHSCEVSRNAINIVCGRGKADINIDSAAISRQHVRLNGTHEMLTIADLGSGNGTSINGIPCLEGEIMFIEPGDIIILGNARFSYNIIPVQDT